MLIYRLSRPFEANAEVVSSLLEAQLREDPYLQHLQQLKAAGLCDFTGRLLRAVALWADGDDTQIERGVEYIGEVCDLQTVPLFEAAYAMYAVRDGLLEFLRKERRNSSPEEDPEGLLADRVARFFDLLVGGVLRAY